MIRPSFGASDSSHFYPTVKETCSVSILKKPENPNTPLQLCGLKRLGYFCVYFLCYGSILSNHYSGLALIGWYSGLGFTMGLFGFNLSHDVMHNAFFSSPRLNPLAAISLI